METTILVGVLDLDSLTLEIVAEMGDSNTISPEGVVAFTGYIAVAKL